MCFLSNNTYFAIIGDIKDSKMIKDRMKTQKQLKFVLDEINKKYKNDISAKFIITLGDEFQGLLLNGTNVLRIIQEVQIKMHPIEIRFGVGVGKILTQINKEMSIGADGPAFYMARDAVEYLKNKEKRNKSYASDVRIEKENDEDKIIDMLNSMFSLMTIVKQNWTERQCEIIWDFSQHKDSQEKCAKRLGIAQSSVQRALVSGNYYAYEEAVNTVNNILGEIN